ncbi:MAG TPA: glycosyltransferase family 4 protein [Polyangiaceae bacterium]|nr:glycosyltransferase family 4 protein [Polyangiaceae bacterium]
MFSWETLHSSAVGGVATHVTELAAALARRGHQVHVFTRPGEGLGSVQQVGDVWYHYCPHELDRNFVDEISAMCRSLVWHFFEAEKHLGRFEVIHSHDWLTADAARWIKQARRELRAVLTMHSTEYGRCGNNLWDGASTRIREREWQGTYEVDRVIAVSSMLKTELGQIYSLPEWKCEVIHNGVPVHEFDGQIDPGRVKQSYALGPLDPTILFCGRLCLQKGPDLLLEAVPGLLRHHESAKFLFLGDGHMLGELQHRAWQLGVSHATRFLGHVKGAARVDLFKACDAVCMPSRNEPFGIVALEGWAAGKPVIASRVGGPNEFVWHGVTGLKIEPSVDSVGWGIGTLFSDFDWARWMGQNGRHAAETAFTWDIAAARTEHCYSS